MGGMPMAGRSVAPLTEARSGPADVNFTLIARKQKFRLVSGRVVDGYTLNGSSPGPVIHAEQATSSGTAGQQRTPVPQRPHVHRP